MVDRLSNEHRALIEKTAAKLREIPVSGGYAIALYQQTLRNVVSDNLIDMIAEVAVRCALNLPDKPEPQRSTYSYDGGYGNYDGNNAD